MTQRIIEERERKVGHGKSVVQSRPRTGQAPSLFLFLSSPFYPFLKCVRHSLAFLYLAPALLILPFHSNHENLVAAALATKAASGVFIVGAKRTPIGTFGGKLKGISATELGVVAGTAAIKASGIEPTIVDHVIFGNVGTGLQRCVCKYPPRKG